MKQRDTTRHPIATPWRYVYLNFWAWVLIAGAVAAACVPTWRWSWAVVVVQVVAIIIALKGAIGILQSWDGKKRKYTLLMERNAQEWRPDTFNEFMMAPCGRLLVKTVLADMGQLHRYRELRKQHGSFWKMKGAYRRQKVRYVIPQPNDTANNTTESKSPDNISRQQN